MPVLTLSCAYVDMHRCATVRVVAVYVSNDGNDVIRKTAHTCRKRKKKKLILQKDGMFVFLGVVTWHTNVVARSSLFQYTYDVVFIFCHTIYIYFIIVCTQHFRCVPTSFASSSFLFWFHLYCVLEKIAALVPFARVSIRNSHNFCKIKQICKQQTFPTRRKNAKN